MEIKQDGKRFVAFEGDKELGEVTFVNAGEDKIIIDHTGVKPEYEGRGVGGALVKAALDYAKAEGIKVIPLCPFAKRYVERHLEYQSLI